MYVVHLMHMITKTLSLHTIILCELSFQLGLFFDIKEESVEGIETPALVTELHSHVINCTLEYR